jgi:hypothetical protein
LSRKHHVRSKAVAAAAAAAKEEAEQAWFKKSCVCNPIVIKDYIIF